MVACPLPRSPSLPPHRTERRAEAGGGLDGDGAGNGDAGRFGDVDKVWVANQTKAEKMFEAENEKASDFVDASTSLPVKLEASCVAVLVPPIVEVLKAEEQPLHSTKEETSDVLLDANSSVPIDLEAKNDDASFIAEVMTKEEEQLYEARLKLEEEEARKREQAARLGFDPNANSVVPIDLEAKNDDASFITEVMTKEEEQLYKARLKVEEEEGRKREQAARLAFDPNANSSVPIDLEAKNDDASFITEVMTKEKEQLYEARLKVEEGEARKREQAARLAFDPNANSSVPIDLEAKNDDASFITEVMTKEEEQLYEARLKVEEEEARKREQAARLAFDPNANSSVPIDLEAKNGDTSFITEVMTKEEEQLYEARLKVEEEEARQREQAARVALDPNACFSKLDELLTETQLYSEFLLEKMEQITDNFVEVKDEEDSVEDKKKGCGRKRKVNYKPQYNDKKAKTAVAAMLTRSREDRSAYDDTLTEEERWEKEQANLVPLMTGGQLKSYQIKGVKWLISLWQNGLNGILADQMGLGKTIQTIGFLTHLKGNGMHGPYMIIAPLSTLSNWVNEISRFVPSLTGLIYHGDKVARAEIRRKFRPKTVGPDFPIIITSYEMAMSDAKFLAHYKWKYVVVDEGHRLKNSKCKLLRKLKRIPMANKLLLTGTPLQNNLAELWSLLNFILPDIFSSHQEFESWFDFSGKGDEEQQEEADEKKRVLVVSKLHAILRPFLLRRMKVDVEQMLPWKKEIIIYSNMTAHQKQIQTHLIEKTFDNYLFESTDIVLRRPGLKMKLNNLMIQLRKNCAHPDLFNAAFDSTSLYPPTDTLLEQCGKFQLLDRLLESLLKQKHKVLIFSQWTKVLDIIEYYLYMKGLNICRIDGSVKLEDRMRQIAEFNDLNSSMNVFILSTRAGGLGINLASADTCILYDSDWNPQMDLQAMDRCHRIGQTRPVHVYRLATSNSVEGRIIKRAFGKLKLEHVVIGKGQFEQNSAKPNVLDEEELLALLRDEQDEEDRMIQTDISDEDLLKVMDRSDLTGPPAAADATPLIPLKGPGWEVVMASKSGGGMLSALIS